jgi:hypothetical protein
LQTAEVAHDIENTDGIVGGSEIVQALPHDEKTARRWQ